MTKYQWLTGAGQWEEADEMLPFPGEENCIPYAESDSLVFTDEEGYIWRKIE